MTIAIACLYGRQRRTLGVDAWTPHALALSLIRTRAEPERPGSQTASQRLQPPGDARPQPMHIHAVRWPSERHQATQRDASTVPSSSGSRVRILPGALTCALTWETRLTGSEAELLWSSNSALQTLRMVDETSDRRGLTPKGARTRAGLLDPLPQRPPVRTCAALPQARRCTSTRTGDGRLRARPAGWPTRRRGIRR